MIGNDIVDLQLAKTQSNWRRKGFLEKQFTDFEIQEINKSENPFLQVWLFWSMKEAAYKCYTQKVKKRFFAPNKFECKNTSNSKGIVLYKNEFFNTETFFTTQYLHTIANCSTKLKVTSTSFLLKEQKNKSREVRTLLLAKLSKKTKVLKTDFGVPYLKDANKTIAISLSHHGNYGGFAFINK